MPITIQISMGEAYDRLSILYIKKEKFSPTSVKGNLARAHYDAMLETFPKEAVTDFDAANTVWWIKILTINKKLWEVEDRLRHMEKALEFGSRFVELARTVYKLNDERSAIKQKIDQTFKEEVGEVKSYVDLESS